MTPFVADTFTRHAHTYEQHATVQRTIALRLLDFLPASDGVHQVLELGCGTGFLSDHLYSTYSQAHLTLLDASPGMLQQMQQKPWTSKAALVHAEAEQYHPPALQDLIVSSCAAQWFRDPVADLRRYWQHLQANGQLVFSVLLQGTLQEWHTCLQETYRHHQLPIQTHQMGHLPLKAWHSWPGLQCHTETHTLTYQNALEALRAIKNAGAAGSAVHLPAHLMRDALRRYDHAYPQGVPVTYQVLYGVCQK
ncbi:methyltransferase domain-containing protein [Deinococcus roseus]|uniref:Malonyl-[acyl-carrier protein] O-methyltransferase n=1 Tax=Deinococcus roseus TaxID=392414 RepID=A0ABQ2CYD5_9DEIO|nr:methyltransferase domain-containing protein [Deinococcus roseus]GGJ33046.1 malonyl-[acyl-carrier protein] O-methyltransferase [Deinococcus roseus]